MPLKNALTKFSEWGSLYWALAIYLVDTLYFTKCCRYSSDRVCFTSDGETMKYDVNILISSIDKSRVLDCHWFWGDEEVSLCYSRSSKFNSCICKLEFTLHELFYWKTNFLIHQIPKGTFMDFSKAERFFTVTVFLKVLPLQVCSTSYSSDIRVNFASGVIWKLLLPFILSLCLLYLILFLMQASKNIIKNTVRYIGINLSEILWLSIA